MTLSLRTNSVPTLWQPAESVTEARTEESPRPSPAESQGKKKLSRQGWRRIERVKEGNTPWSEWHSRQLSIPQDVSRGSSLQAKEDAWSSLPSDSSAATKPCTWATVPHFYLRNQTPHFELWVRKYHTSSKLLPSRMKGKVSFPPFSLTLLVLQLSGEGTP